MSLVDDAGPRLAPASTGGAEYNDSLDARAILDRIGCDAKRASILSRFREAWRSSNPTLDDMTKITNRTRLLQEGLRIVHAQGFTGASVRDIVRAAGVPQGSFTNHFASKEAFGLEVLELYYENTQDMLARTLDNEELTPIDRLRAYVRANAAALDGDEVHHGCLYGNISAEAAETTGAIHTRLIEIFDLLQDKIARCLRAAVKTGEVTKRVKPAEMASFIFSSMQGAILLSKARGSSLPMQRFEQVLFATLLNGEG